MITTVGKELVKQVLPEGYKHYADKPLDGKTIKELTTSLAKSDPDKYIDTIHKLNDIGRTVVSTYGRDASLQLKDFAPPAEVQAKKEAMREAINAIKEDDKLTPQEKSDRIFKLSLKFQKNMSDLVYKSTLKRNNSMARQIESGSRGNKTQLMQLLVGDMLMVDALGRPIPIPGLTSYSEGASPFDYWLGAQSSRKGTVDTQFATADSGYFAKLMTNVGHRQVVTKEDCGTTNGMRVDGDDKDNVGSILQQDAGPLKKGTIITEEHLPLLAGKKVLVRSSTTCQAPEGVCSKCAGVRESGDLPKVGDRVGVNAVKAFTEAVTQTALCLVENTLVRMADWSTKKIQDIKVGDMVLGADENARTFPVKVVNTFNNGLKDVYKTIYRYSTSIKSTIDIECTLDHKMLQMTHKSSCKGEIYNGMPRILPVGDPNSKIKAVLTEEFDDTGAGFKHEPMALLCGLLLGDGCYTKSVRGVHFSCADPSLIDELKEYMNSLGLYFHKLKGHDGIYYSVSSYSKGGAQDRITGKYKEGGYTNPAKKWLAKEGMLHKYAHEKEIPESAYRWDNESIAQLIGGLIVTDGCLYHSKNQIRPYVTFGVTSKRLVEQLAELLQWRFGIYTTRIKCNFNKNHRKRPLYSVTISKEDAIEKFLKIIPLYGVKRGKASEYREYMAGLKRRANLKYNRCLRVSQELIGPRPTYDIEVDSPSHLFVLANGLIVSNSSKHVGGVGSGDKDKKGKQLSGFKEIVQFVQVPKNFIGGAVLTANEGRVTQVVNAPQGGKYVLINGQQYHVPVEQEVTVKPGQSVEAGDTISTGVPNPSELAYHKGIGEGRNYFINKFRDILKNNGTNTNRRNLELLTRSFVSKVKVTSPEGLDGNIIGDVVDYDYIASNWKPRKGSKIRPVAGSTKGYLERPVLHYTIGTKVTPSVIKTLKENGIKDVEVHDDPPPFEPFVVRAQDFLQHDKDWQTRLGGENLKKTIINAATRGAASYKKSTSYFPEIVNMGT